MIDYSAIDKKVSDFFIIKNDFENNKISKLKFEQERNKMVEEILPIILAKANRYKGFSNYPDLVQDGYEALMLALKTYDPTKGSFTWWSKKYIDTRIARSANKHSVIKFPLKKAKDMMPYKVAELPDILDCSLNPEQRLSSEEIKLIIGSALEKLSEEESNILRLLYNFDDGSKQLSLAAICRQLHISRKYADKLIKKSSKNLIKILNDSKHL